MTTIQAQGSVQLGNGTKGGCVGNYIGFARIMNGTSVWFTPPSGSTSCVITDNNGGAYTGKIECVESVSLANWCGLAGLPPVALTCPVASANRYQFSIYFSANAPAAGTVLTLQIQWLP